MKRNIAIIGSTGSIGKQTLEIIKKNKKQFNVLLLSTNENIGEILKQVKIFKPKYIIITNKKKFEYLKKKEKKIKIFNNYDCFKKIFRKKFDEVWRVSLSIATLYKCSPTILRSV